MGNKRIKTKKQNKQKRTCPYLFLFFILGLQKSLFKKPKGVDDPQER